MKHTPGPWVADDDGSILQGEDSDIIASADLAFGKANARLIAAAPELLEALRSVRSMLMTEFQAEGQPHISIQLDKITSAIAKATGGAE